MEELLARTMEVAVTLKLIAKKDLSCVILDSILMESLGVKPEVVHADLG